MKQNLKLISMEDVRAEKVRWLWYPYLPRGKITIVQGYPGKGKTTFALAVVARLTLGLPMQGEENALPPVTEQGTWSLRLRRASIAPNYIPGTLRGVAPYPSPLREGERRNERCQEKNARCHVRPLPGIYSGRESWNEVITILSRTPKTISETHTVSRRGRTITVENKFPELTNQEREEQSREIESGLFDIFVKYEDSLSRAAGV